MSKKTNTVSCDTAESINKIVLCSLTNRLYFPFTSTSVLFCRPGDSINWPVLQVPRSSNKGPHFRQRTYSVGQTGRLRIRPYTVQRWSKGEQSRLERSGGPWTGTPTTSQTVPVKASEWDPGVTQRHVDDRRRYVTSCISILCSVHCRGVKSCQHITIPPQLHNSRRIGVLQNSL